MDDLGNRAAQSPTKGAERRQTFEGEAQRRGVPDDAQEWSRTRHGGVYDHAEERNDDPEQPSSGRHFHTRKAWRGETNTWVST